jgi:murein DD-endopeptidase MepM/ murein hydrolase activator NlpD
MKYFLIIIFSISFSINARSQQTDSLPTNYFRSPLGIPLYLAGNFGELRSNHFHSGLDMKTQGREGFNIYAAADGFISRVKISPWGYGNTIYIDHPNGYTTVYAHLQRYKGEIAEQIKKYQYQNESWEIDWYPADTLMKVKKGDIIALSGNSGGSGGPHLHFEIRETKSEHPVNPLLCGFDIKDDIKPIIKSIAIFPLNDTSYVNNKNVMQQFDVVGSNGSYQLKYNSPINVYGQVGIGIETIDKLNGVSNRNGIYSIQLSNNSEVIYKSEMKKFSFDESRALNSLIDYETYLRSRTRFQKSFIEENNPLSIYSAKKNNGIISMSNATNNLFDYLVIDSYGNSSTLQFTLTGLKPTTTSPKVKSKIDTIFSYKDINIFDKQNIKMEIPQNALYKNLEFEFQIKDTMRGAITPTYQLHNDYTPLHDYITVSIKPGRISEVLRNKAIIVNIDRNGRFYSRGGEWRNNYLSAKSKVFGGYTIMIDTIAPTIKPYNIYANKNMSKNSSIIVSIADNLSGVKSYRGEIDGKWILMEYESKKAHLIHEFDNLPSGNHSFKLTVTDDVGNTTTTEIPFIR